MLRILLIHLPIVKLSMKARPHQENVRLALAEEDPLERGVEAETELCLEEWMFATMALGSSAVHAPGLENLAKYSCGLGESGKVTKDAEETSVCWEAWSRTPVATRLAATKSANFSLLQSFIRRFLASDGDVEWASAGVVADAVAQSVRLSKTIVRRENT
uniref:Uncharacterized protein n=1 Tax=Mycena chlorophos TaxID=658473 RepID=A0ABQ0KUK5_MYCCL|nr:predicted protein [Mycena chlorophos]